MTAKVGGHFLIEILFLILDSRKRPYLTGAVAFLCLDSGGPALRVISHFGCAAEETPLRQIVLCLSELNGHRRFSFLRCHLHFFLRRCPFAPTWTCHQIVKG